MNTPPHTLLQPVVLVGGKSARFGRDKLLEPWDSGVLVQRPINALRAVFGPRVLLVGPCDPRVAALADGTIGDEHAGAGPIGGIVSALNASTGGIFVLAGDMPDFGTAEIRAILAAAEHAGSALAVLARSDRLEPCAGMYFQSALAPLNARLHAGESRLHDAIPAAQRIEVPMTHAALRNVNEPGT